MRQIPLHLITSDEQQERIGRSLAALDFSATASLVSIWDFPTSCDAIRVHQHDAFEVLDIEKVAGPISHDRDRRDSAFLCFVFGNRADPASRRLASRTPIAASINAPRSRKRASVARACCNQTRPAIRTQHPMANSATNELRRPATLKFTACFSGGAAARLRRVLLSGTCAPAAFRG